MRKDLVAAAAILTVWGVSAAQAGTTVIEKSSPDTVVVDRPAAESTTVEKRESSDGCSTKSVTKENDVGDRKTVTKESCD